MNLSELSDRFNTHLKCVEHLEAVRWGTQPECPYCGSTNIYVRGRKRKFKKNRTAHVYKTPRYFCNDCRRDFTVLTGTIFEASKLPLQKWFQIIALMLNNPNGVSAMNIHINVGITYKTAWYSAMRIRCAMLDQPDMLEGIVEMDETYMGGRKRHRPLKSSTAYLGYKGVKTDEWGKKSWKRGRGTDKVKVVGVVSRDKHGKIGKVAMKVENDRLTGETMLRILKRYVNVDKKKTKVMTDEFKGYNAFDKHLLHYTVNHMSKEYVRHLKGIKGGIHTGTIDAVWNIIKSGIKGQYRVLSRKYLPFYLAESAYKYNRRDKKKTNAPFNQTIANAVLDDKCEVNYKPKKHPSLLAYGRKEKKKLVGKKPKRVPVLRGKKRNLSRSRNKSRRRVKGKKKMGRRK